MFNIEVFNIFLIGFIIVMVVFIVIFLVAKARKHPLYNKSKETEDEERKDIIMKVVHHDTIENYTSSKEYYDKIDKILEKHLSPEAIEKTVLEVTEQLKREGKISKDFSWDKVKKKGEENEV